MALKKENVVKNKINKINQTKHNQCDILKHKHNYKCILNQKASPLSYGNTLILYAGNSPKSVAQDSNAQAIA